MQPHNRREFLASLTTALAAAGPVGALAAPVPAPPARDDRSYWLSVLQRVSEPVLTQLAANQLKARMPVESPASKPQGRKPATYLEALGRTLSGIAPWLELASKTGPESVAGPRLAALARQAIANITNPAAADYVSFTAAPQCLVDAAFLSHALLRARQQLWEQLDAEAKPRLLSALQATRKITPGSNNWLLFSAMVETFLASAGAEWKPEPIERALQAHESWYKGDGTYGDGPEFHWDYYNSYVIQPMLVDILEHMGKVTPRWADRLPQVLGRARRYAAVQERLIAPDGSYPVVGRSIAYRCGAFQLLAQMALRQQLPAGLPPAQVRSALTAVIHRTMDAPGTFDSEGWLQVGLCGHQPELAEPYISTGSLYLCSFALLPLGLPATDPFWAAAPVEWTSRQVWSGRDLHADHAYSDHK